MNVDWRSRLHAWLWRAPLDARRTWKSELLGLVRLTLVLWRDLLRGQLTLRATSLVYTTLLSLVPLLALSFSVLKAFGVHNQVAPVLTAFLAPLGEQSALVTERILEYIDKLNVRVLGAIGLALLLYTVASLLQKIEESVNFIWHVTRLRGLARRLSGYLGVLLVGPVLAFALVGASRTLSATPLARELLAREPVGALVHAVGSVLPVGAAIAIFTLAYALVPSTRVRARAALAGGAVAGVAWQLVAWGFASFAAKSTQYAAIYSSLAILILFLIWLYLNWLVLLLGASIAFYHQHPEYLIAPQGEPRLSNRMRERLAVSAMYLIAQSHHDGAAPWTLAALTQRLGVPAHALEVVLAAMQGAGLLAQTDADPAAYLPARDLARITLGGILDTVRAAGEDRFLGPAELRAPEQLAPLLARTERAAAERVGDLTLRELLAGAAPPAAPTADAPPASG
jgi:membrane protein